MDADDTTPDEAFAWIEFEDDARTAAIGLWIHGNYLPDSGSEDEG